MKKLVLIITSFFLITALFGQEQQPQKIQQQKVTKEVKSAQSKDEQPQRYINNKTTTANESISYSVGRDGVQHVVREEKKPEDFSTETIEAVKEQLKELYGPYYEKYGEPKLGGYAEIYERCEFIPLNAAPSGIVNILSLGIKDKYNPEKIYQDNLKKFNPETFNVLKYQIDYYAKEDQYYRLYETNTVLKINKLD